VASGSPPALHTARDQHLQLNIQLKVSFNPCCTTTTEQHRDKVNTQCTVWTCHKGHGFAAVCPCTQCCCTTSAAVVSAQSATGRVSPASATTTDALNPNTSVYDGDGFDVGDRWTGCDDDALCCYYSCLSRIQHLVSSKHRQTSTLSQCASDNL
jgi:hypothetical protein